jgi:hypothetical protein
MGAPQQFPAVEDVFPHFAHLYCAIASHLLSSDRVVQRHRRRSFTAETNDWTLASPDGHCIISVFLGEDGALSYKV